MGKINYNLPLEFTNLYLAQVPVQGGAQVVVKEVRVSMMWDEIRGIEDFADHHMFPNHQDIPKCRIVLARDIQGTYLALIDYNEMSDAWANYIIWKNKQIPKFKLN